MIYIKHLLKSIIIISLCLVLSACNFTKPIITNIEDEIISNKWIYNKENSNNFSAELSFEDSTAFLKISDSKKSIYKISGIYYFSNNILYITDVKLKHCFEFGYKLDNSTLTLDFNELNINLFKKQSP